MYPRHIAGCIFQMYVCGFIVDVTEAALGLLYICVCQQK